MEKCIPGNLVGHGKTLWEVRCPMALRRGKIHLRCTQVAQVLPMSRCMRSTVDSTYIAIHAIVRLLRIESLQRAQRGKDKENEMLKR
jgi:hypothetical protein